MLVLIWVGLFLSGLAALVDRYGLPCGPSTCSVPGWLYDFQSLIGGVLAAVAAIATVIVLRMQIRQASKDVALQIAHERGTREAERREDIVRELDGINTALFNEAESLAGALVVVTATLESVTEAARQVAADDLLGFVQQLHDPVAHFREQIIASDLAIKPLPLSKTRAARAALAAISGHCVLMSSEIDLALHKQKSAQHALMQLRNHRDGAARQIETLRQPARFQIEGL